MLPQFPSKTGAGAAAVVTGSFLAGAMINLTTLTVPVLMETTTQASQLVHQWVRVYHYGHQMYPFLAVTTCLLYGYLAYSKHAAHKPWRVFAVAAATTLSMVPYTWIFMVPTNNALFRSHALSKAGQVTGWGETQELLTTWNALHFTRSLLPLTGAVIGLLGTCQVPIF